MDILNREQIQALSEPREGPCVSIYLPTHRKSREIEQDPIRLKNLLAEAETQLVDSGLRSPLAQQMLNPAVELLDDYDFWQHQSYGLALFLADDFLLGYRLPFHFQELVIVTDRFHIKPLMPVLSGDGRFYVLALSQNSVRLLHGTRFSISEVEVEDIPESLAEALWADDAERQLQHHTSTSANSTRGGRMMFHGHGVVKDDKKDNILRYFQQIDRGLQDVLGDDSAPLLLAGVDYLLPIYREANSYRSLLKDSIEGNPEELSEKELHHHAWELVEPVFQIALQGARARYAELTSTDRASKDLRTIVAAAYYGRVDTLFVALGAHQWGVFDPSSNTVLFHADAAPGRHDLLDAAAVETLVHGGTVYAVEPDRIPEDTPAAAIFRWNRSGPTELRRS
jgi:hypothetical protein